MLHPCSFLPAVLVVPVTTHAFKTRKHTFPCSVAKLAWLQSETHTLGWSNDTDIKGGGATHTHSEGRDKGLEGVGWKETHTHAHKLNHMATHT